MTDASRHRADARATLVEAIADLPAAEAADQLQLFMADLVGMLAESGGDLDKLGAAVATARAVLVGLIAGKDPAVMIDDVVERAYWHGHAIASNRFAVDLRAGKSRDTRAALREFFGLAPLEGWGPPQAFVAPPANPHPDGCHTTDATALRDCTSDGHHECASCARFDAAGRAARGDGPIGGP